MKRKKESQVHYIKSSSEWVIRLRSNDLEWSVNVISERERNDLSGK